MPTKKTKDRDKKTRPRGRAAPRPKKKGAMPARQAAEREAPVSSERERAEDIEPIGQPPFTGSR